MLIDSLHNVDALPVHADFYSSRSSLQLPKIPNSKFVTRVRSPPDESRDLCIVPERNIIIIFSLPPSLPHYLKR